MNVALCVSFLLNEEGIHRKRRAGGEEGIHRKRRAGGERGEEEVGKV